MIDTLGVFKWYPGSSRSTNEDKTNNLFVNTCVIDKRPDDVLTGGSMTRRRKLLERRRNNLK